MLLDVVELDWIYWVCSNPLTIKLDLFNYKKNKSEYKTGTNRFIAVLWDEFAATNCKLSGQ